MTRDVTAQVPGRRTGFSVKQLLTPGKDETSEMDTLEIKAKPLSLVGSVLSLRRDDYWDGGAHPSGAIEYYALDPTRLRARLTLTDLFPDRDVVRALWADPIVRRSLTKAGVQSPPATAAALERKLEDQSFGGEEGSKYGYGKDFLKGFSFHHLEGDRVAVRLCVSWYTEIYRFNSTEIGILLPIPARLRAAFQSAAAGREGFLTRSLPPALKGKEAFLINISRK